MSQGMFQVRRGETIIAPCVDQRSAKLVADDLSRWYDDIKVVPVVLVVGERPFQQTN